LDGKSKRQGGMKKEQQTRAKKMVLLHQQQVYQQQMDVLPLERPVTQMTSPAKAFSANSSVENRDNVCKAAVCSLLGNSREDDDRDGEGVVERIAI